MKEDAQKIAIAELSGLDNLLKLAREHGIDYTIDIKRGHTVYKTFPFSSGIITTKKEEFMKKLTEGILRGAGRWVNENLLTK